MFSSASQDSIKSAATAALPAGLLASLLQSVVGASLPGLLSLLSAKFSPEVPATGATPQDALDAFVGQEVDALSAAIEADAASIPVVGSLLVNTFKTVIAPSLRSAITAEVDSAFKALIAKISAPTTPITPTTPTTPTTPPAA